VLRACVRRRAPDAPASKANDALMLAVVTPPAAMP
jgi:hypothetical protein